jgi:hypothetical protein
VPVLCNTPAHVECRVSRSFGARGDRRRHPSLGRAERRGAGPESVNQLFRELSQGNAAYLDLAAAMDGGLSREDRQKLFRGPIHLASTGNRYVAAELVAIVKSLIRE